jgi:two-component system, chemotaxis family, CheB/CheR fusion protein
MDTGMPRFPIVGIGASAGGVEALQALFRAMPDPPLAMAFVIVTHLGPDHESALPSILHECTSMPVLPARDGQAVMPGHAYVLPRNAIITIAGARLALRDQAADLPRERHPIDVFLASLAADQHEWAAGIVLSGSGNDGTLGLKAIKQGGGLTIAQSADGAPLRYAEMPSSAIAGGGVDVSITVQEMPARLGEFASLLAPSGAPGADSFPADDEAAAAAHAEIAAILLDRVGHDFSGYKDKTFFRRVQRRMQVLRLPDDRGLPHSARARPGGSGQAVQRPADRRHRLLPRPDAFDALAERVIPALFRDRVRRPTPCASGCPAAPPVRKPIPSRSCCANG